MSDVYFGGTLQMKIDEGSQVRDDDPMTCHGKYPHKIPRVYLEGYVAYYDQYLFNRISDSVVMVRDDLIVEYTQSKYTELLTEDENGKAIWVDGRTAASDGRGDGKHLDYRNAYEYSVVEYNMVTHEKKRYKVRQEEATQFDVWDSIRIAELCGEDMLYRELTVKEDAPMFQLVETDEGFYF